MTPVEIFHDSEELQAYLARAAERPPGEARCELIDLVHQLLARKVRIEEMAARARRRSRSPRATAEVRRGRHQLVFRVLWHERVIRRIRGTLDNLPR